MTDSEPKDYKFKHAKHISLDGYNGIAANHMELNNPVADRFMAVSDMRADIAIVQKPHDRVLDYDELGFIQVGKFLRMPRLDLWRKDGLVAVKKEEDAWIVAVDDQGIADEITHGNTTERFEDEFKARFWQETRKGLQSCLVKEKFLNSGNYIHLTFAASYCLAAPKELLVYPLLTIAEMAGGEAPHVTLAKIAALYVITNVAYNTLNLTTVGLDLIRTGAHKLLGDDDLTIRRMPHMADFQEPFVKHSLPDLLMPPVPVDRYLRGLIYLNKHGDKFIT